MSTTLTVLEGLCEHPIPGRRQSDYEPGELYVTRFFGGIDRGVSIQLTITHDSGRDSHIQLDNRGAHLLLKALQDGLGHVSIEELRPSKDPNCVCGHPVVDHEFNGCMECECKKVHDPKDEENDDFKGGLNRGN